MLKEPQQYNPVKFKHCVYLQMLNPLTVPLGVAKENVRDRKSVV